MPAKTIKVYDRPFPSHYEMIVPEPDRKWPIEVWSSELSDNEVAVFYRHCQTESPWGSNGKPIRSSDETCDVFDSLEEAQQHCRSIVEAHWSVICEIRNKAGDVVARIRNNQKLARFGVANAFGLLLTIFFFTLAGGLVLLVLFGAKDLATGSLKDVQTGWLRLHWILATFVAFGTGILLWFLSLWISVLRRSARLARKISAQDKALANQAQQLASSSNAEDRVRARELFREYQERLIELRRDKKTT
jgi:hypothetical protein